MSLQEFREVFAREVEAHLAKLQQKSFEKSRDRSGDASVTSTAFGGAASPGSFTRSRLSPGGESLGAGPELAHLGEVRRLAADMTECILRRAAGHAAAWGLEEEEEASACLGRQGTSALCRAAEEEGAAARSRLQARVQELEAGLQSRRAEEAERTARLFERCKGQYDATLRAHEQELREVRRGATAGAADCQGRPAESAELHREFAEHVGRIQGHILATKEAVGRLEGRARGVEQVEAQQRRPPPAVEALLAGLASDGLEGLEEQDRALCEAIEKGEQVCKRLRRHLAGA